MGTTDALVQGYPIPGIMVVGNPLDNKVVGIGGATLRLDWMHFLFIASIESLRNIEGVEPVISRVL